MGINFVGEHKNSSWAGKVTNESLNSYLPSKGRFIFCGKRGIRERQSKLEGECEHWEILSARYLTEDVY